MWADRKCNDSPYVSVNETFSNGTTIVKTPSQYTCLKEYDYTLTNKMFHKAYCKKLGMETKNYTEWIKCMEKTTMK